MHSLLHNSFHASASSSTSRACVTDSKAESWDPLYLRFWPRSHPLLILSPVSRCSAGPPTHFYEPVAINQSGEHWAQIAFMSHSQPSSRNSANPWGSIPPPPSAAMLCPALRCLKANIVQPIEMRCNSLAGNIQIFCMPPNVALVTNFVLLLLLFSPSTWLD